MSLLEICRNNNNRSKYGDNAAAADIGYETKEEEKHVSEYEFSSWNMTFLL